MKTFEALTEHEQHTYNGRIITFGLTEAETCFLKKLTCNKNIEVYSSDIASDLISIQATAIVVCAKKLKTEDLELLKNYYSKVSANTDEKIFWIGLPQPNVHIRPFFICLESLDDITLPFEKMLTKIH